MIGGLRGDAESRHPVELRSGIEIINGGERDRERYSERELEREGEGARRSPPPTSAVVAGKPFSPNAGEDEKGGSGVGKEGNQRWPLSLFPSSPPKI